MNSLLQNSQATYCTQSIPNQDEVYHKYLVVWQLNVAKGLKQTNKPKRQVYKKSTYDWLEYNTSQGLSGHKLLRTLSQPPTSPQIPILHK
jgi:hypothetical protein